MDYIEAGIEVIKLIELNGFKAYFVGGVVRDYLLNEPYHDIDIATDALPSDLQKLFTISNKGINYSSVVISYEGFEFETTTFREEFDYKDNRHPEYKVIKNLDGDLVRRDFTINAMAMDKEFNVVDLFGGLEDLKHKVIRTVGDPNKRFNEDALRMLRACYFAAKLGFEIDVNTLEAMKNNAELVTKLSNDRIMWELRKIVESKHSIIGLKYLETSDIINFLPDLKTGILTITNLDYNVSSYRDFLTIVFFKKEREMEYYSLTVKEKTFIKEINEIVSLDLTDPLVIYHNGLKKCVEANNLKVLYGLSDNFEDEIKDKYDNLPIHQLIDLKIRGIEIVKVNPKIASNMISSVENTLIKEVIEGKLTNDYEEIKKYILKKYK